MQIPAKQVKIAAVFTYVLTAIVLGWSFFLIIWFMVHDVHDQGEWAAVWIFLILGVALYLLARILLRRAQRAGE